ncbi:uncharacterized protein SETTUDRAFT_157224 [Exserohilum turcica Et28A]|uniref:G-protein coupled receptors family 2 profile 2 domain-containing protein n=1 Tax=Exserohilum turcicum (strain 28A) TaxID=671987 RepID=R0JUU1_EXST2|nr:uncharacterized protein SETTUDRAFT_157224 [Exserohilum turcica Et28A]EOA81274.1 hypothetical protein SETTUDRAFT_157224 [Exserohilum turcica Et28A]
MSDPLSPDKEFALMVATRTASVFSVIGSSIIVSTFIYFPFFRKPINRLVFYATLGNILTNVATLMSVSVIPKDGESPSGLCELQGLLIQWFMVADSFWVLCMAVNVLLVFFYGYDARQLRGLEKWYFVFSYGVPAVPVVIYVSLDHVGRPIIGSATLWCWVAVEHDWMRIAFFYAPAWVMIFGTCTIYTITGYRIWQRTVELHSLSQDSYHFGTIESTIGAKGGDMVNGSAANKIVVTTQIQCDIQSIDSFSSVQMFSMGTQPDDQITEQPLDDLEAQNSLHSSKSECHGGEVTMITSTLPADDSEVPNLSTPRFVGKKRGRTHAAAMAYFQVAFLMFIALTIVWVPSSINRMYQFVNARHPSFALNIISAIVLPLQGAWNAAIYIFTTRAECRRAWRETLSKTRGKPLQPQLQQDLFHKTISSSQATRESTIDIALDEILERGTWVHHTGIPR